MVYRVISFVCNSDHAGFEIGFVEIVQEGGKWSVEVSAHTQQSFSTELVSILAKLDSLKPGELFELHRKMGILAGEEINHFIKEHSLEYKSGLIAYEGLENSFTAGHAIGDGGAVAAITRLPVVSDIHSIDRALGGKGKSLDKLAGITGLELTAITSNALRGVFRWREEPNMFSSETGAPYDSIGGALWVGSGEFL